MSRISARTQQLLNEIDERESFEGDNIADLLQAALIDGSVNDDADLSRMAAGYVAAGLVVDPREWLT